MPFAVHRSAWSFIEACIRHHSDCIQVARQSDPVHGRLRAASGLPGLGSARLPSAEPLQIILKPGAADGRVVGLHVAASRVVPGLTVVGGTWAARIVLAVLVIGAPAAMGRLSNGCSCDRRREWTELSPAREALACRRLRRVAHSERAGRRALPTGADPTAG